MSRYTGAGEPDENHLTGQQMPQRAASGAVAACSDPVPLLEVSGLLDAELRLRLTAFREGAAIQIDPGLLRSGGIMMNGAGQQLFAGAAFPQNQNAGVGAGYSFRHQH